MMFLLRLAFWVTLICLLLPASNEDSRRLISSAGQAVADMRGFCQRNPQTCEDMRVTMTALLTRFRSGAETLQAWLAQQGSEGEDRADAAPGLESRSAVAAGHPDSSPVRRLGKSNQLPLQPITKWQDSLNSADKQMPWRGPAL